MYIKKYICVYKEIYFRIYENLSEYIRKYISAYAEISPPFWCDKNADAELLGIGGEVFFEDTKALRIAEMF